MRDYALEVWRLLDSHSELIERERVAQRMVNVPQGRMKRLSDAFKIGPIDSEDASPLPFAIIADDRHDVSCLRLPDLQLLLARLKVC